MKVTVILMVFTITLLFVSCQSHIRSVENNSLLRVFQKVLEDELQVKMNEKSGSCSCVQYKCSCCEHVDIEKIGLNDTVCAGLAYLSKDYGVEFTITVDDRTLFNESVSLKNPPPLCANIPYLKKLASLCIKFSNLTFDNGAASGCMTVMVKAELIKVVEFKLGCFRIPLREAGQHGELTKMDSNKTIQPKLSKEDKIKLLSNLGLMGKTFEDGRLVNQVIIN